VAKLFNKFRDISQEKEVHAGRKSTHYCLVKEELHPKFTLPLLEPSTNLNSFNF
jgi:hypothetical protein